MMRTQLQLSRFLMALCLVGALPTLSAAQSQKAMRPVTLVENAKIPGGKKAMVISKASGTERDFVALAPGATASDLTAALRVLDAMHARFGETVPRDMAAAIPQAPARPNNVRAKLHGIFLDQLRSSKPKAVKGFGKVKSVQIRVPARQQKAK